MKIGSSHRVNASVALGQGSLFNNRHLRRDFEFRINVFQVPFEGFALETSPEFQPIFNTRITIKFIVVVHLAKYNVVIILVFSSGLNIVITLQMELLLPKALSSSSNSCNHPSKLRQLFLYFLQTQLQSLQGMYRDVAYGKRDLLSNMVRFPMFLHIAKHES